MEVNLGDVVDTVYIKNATVVDILGEYFLLDFDSTKNNNYTFNRCWVHEKSIIATRAG